MQRRAVGLAAILLALAPLRLALGQGASVGFAEGTPVNRPPRRILTVWNGIPVPEPEFRWTRELPGPSGRIILAKSDLAHSSTGLARRVETERLEGVAGAVVGRGRKQRETVRLRLSTRVGRVRAYLDYIAGFHVLCEATPGQPCELSGTPCRQGQSRTSIFSGDDAGVLLEAHDGPVEGVVIELLR